MCIHTADSLCCAVETNTTLESSYISYVLVAQSCLTLCNPIDCRLLGCSVHGILQARILEWVAIFSCRGSSTPRDWTQVSHIASRFFTSWATGKPKNTGVGSLSLLHRIFLTQEWNRDLLHHRRILYQLSYEGSPELKLEWVVTKHNFTNKGKIPLLCI